MIPQIVPAEEKLDERFIAQMKESIRSKGDVSFFLCSDAIDRYRTPISQNTDKSNFSWRVDENGELRQ